MPTKTISKTVNDNEPLRVSDLQPADWLAPATPRGPQPTEKEQRVIDAYRRGADPVGLVRGFSISPAVLFKILQLDISENADLFKRLSEEYNGLQKRALT